MITPTEAAEILDITVEDLLYSRARGLPPGNMGYNVVVDGEILLFFRPHDLLPPPTPNSIAANPERAAEMVQAVGRDLTDSHDSPPSSQIATTALPDRPGDEQTEIPTNEAVNPSGASDSTSSKDVYFRLDDSDSLDRSGKLSNPLYCWHCDRLFSTASGKASHDRAKHGG